jgi:hypothetical protein
MFDLRLHFSTLTFFEQMHWTPILHSAAFSGRHKTQNRDAQHNNIQRDIKNGEALCNINVMLCAALQE